MPRWTTYVLQCADASYYAGSTTDLSRRLEEHQSGLGARYTRSRLPVKLVWSQAALSRVKAQQREAKIKALSRAEKQALIRRAARLR
jgi:predicted GIY-YIG superfamily endonuclease